MNGDSMDLICYKYEGWQPKIRPAGPKRAWMDATNERYAYRCLPLAIANAHGWELLSPCAFEAKWDGGTDLEAVQVRMDSGYPERVKPVTLFGYGTVTFHIEGIFRTPPGWNLYVTGPANSQKDAIQALSGIIETDWSPYTFTMNWRFTRAGQWVRFEEHEPIAFFFPVERGKVQQFAPRIAKLEENEELLRQFEKWSTSRTAFQKWVVEANPPSPSEKWQKLYYRGLDADGAPGPADHQAKLRLPHFTGPDGSVMDPPEFKACPMRSAQPEAMAPLNLLLSGRGEPRAKSLMMENPALALTLERIGFDAKPQNAVLRVEPPVQVKPAVAAGAELALKQRDWILDAQARQRRLSRRTAGVGRERNLAGEAFLDGYYALSRPVVIEGAMAGWPALERWTPDYLARTVGPIEGQCWSPALEPLEQDLGWLDAYLTRRHGTLSVAALGTFTPLHFELTNILVAQVVGATRMVLMPPAETSRLHQERGRFSAVHDITDEERLARFPPAREAETMALTLEAGELLYVPLGWWQQSTALDFSVTLTSTNFKWPNEGHASFPAA